MTINDKAWRANLRAALASFITEHMPLDDPFTDDLIDDAWRIAERLESRLVIEYARVVDEHRPAPAVREATE